MYTVESSVWDAYFSQLTTSNVLYKIKVLVYGVFIIYNTICVFRRDVVTTDDMVPSLQSNDFWYALTQSIRDNKIFLNYLVLVKRTLKKMLCTRRFNPYEMWWLFRCSICGHSPVIIWCASLLGKDWFFGVLDKRYHFRLKIDSIKICVDNSILHV